MTFSEGPKDSNMDVKEIERNLDVAVNLLKALSNEKRLLVICTLYKGERSVGDLEQVIGLSQSALSQHLARLRRDGIVETRRDAQTIYYSLKDEAAQSILSTLYDIYCPDAGGRIDPIDHVSKMIKSKTKS